MGGEAEDSSSIVTWSSFVVVDGWITTCKKLEFKA